MKRVWLVLLLAVFLGRPSIAAPILELDPNVQRIEVSVDRGSQNGGVFLYFRISVDGLKIYESAVGDVSVVRIRESDQIIGTQYKVIAETKIRAAQRAKSLIVLDPSAAYSDNKLLTVAELIPQSEVASILQRLNALEAEVEKLKSR